MLACSGNKENEVWMYDDEGNYIYSGVMARDVAVKLIDELARYKIREKVFKPTRIAVESLERLWVRELGGWYYYA